MALPKNVTELISELHKAYKTSKAEDKEDKIKSLELEIEEQRRDYDSLDKMYESARAKNYTLLAAAFTLLGFLYGTSPQEHTLRLKLFIPKESYGVVVYAVAASLFLFALILLLFATKANKWSTAYDNNQEDSVKSTYEGYLKYMKKRYLYCSGVNGNSYSRKQFLLDMSYMPLLVGGILLVVLKIFSA